MTAWPGAVSNILILAPGGRDASVASTILREAGMASTCCADLSALVAKLEDGTSFVVMTEEAVRAADLRSLQSNLAAQPAWSDLPFIVLTQRGGGPEHNSGTVRLSELLGNVTFLERPFHATTFVSVASTALKGRQRQYEARARIEELHESEGRLQTALLAGQLGSWEFEIVTGTLTTSASCRALFGRAADQPFSYADLLESIHAADRPRMQQAVEATVSTGVDYAIECRNIWPDDTEHWCELRARLVDKDRPGAKLVGVSADITTRKTSEATLRYLNETLEERVSVRTKELEQTHAAMLLEIEQRERAEARLRQAQKMEMIGQLTGGVAHDFNNLLMAVLGNLDLLRKHLTTDARSLRLIDGAIQGAQRGAVLTQRLLAFARRQDLQVAPKSISDLVRGMSDLIERSAGAEIEVKLDLPTEMPLAVVDANQIELALLNLVVNARDAMPGGGTLLVKVDLVEPDESSELKPGSYVRLSVLDTGLGMDVQTLGRAVEPFFSTKELGKGTGLGLSMIQGLAEQLHGALRLSSVLGQGTLAELWLPVSSETAQEVVYPLAEIERASVPKSTILVVDDDFMIAMSTVDMLEDLGHKVVEANSGDKALEILRQNPNIDLLITDFSMPKMNGAQLAATARAIRPDLPILLATGYAELPADTILDVPRIGKPYVQHQIEAEIGKLLGSKTG